jgi:hypothetical protein
VNIGLPPQRIPLLKLELQTLHFGRPTDLGEKLFEKALQLSYDWLSELN